MQWNLLESAVEVKGREWRLLVAISPDVGQTSRGRTSKPPTLQIIKKQKWRKQGFVDLKSFWPFSFFDKKIPTFLSEEWFWGKDPGGQKSRWWPSPRLRRIVGVSWQTTVDLDSTVDSQCTVDLRVDLDSQHTVGRPGGTQLWTTVTNSTHSQFPKSRNRLFFTWKRWLCLGSGHPLALESPSPIYLPFENRFRLTGKHVFAFSVKLHVPPILMSHSVFVFDTSPMFSDDDGGGMGRGDVPLCPRRNPSSVPRPTRESPWPRTTQLARISQSIKKYQNKYKWWISDKIPYSHPILNTSDTPLTHLWTTQERDFHKKKCRQSYFEMEAKMFPALNNPPSCRG